MSREKDKGTRFETDQLRHAQLVFDCPSIHREVLHGKGDLGDIVGITCCDTPVTVECKNVKAIQPSQWWKEADRERENAQNPLAIVIWKRKGKAKPGDQWVTMPAYMHRKHMAVSGTSGVICVEFGRLGGWKAYEDAWQQVRREMLKQGSIHGCFTHRKQGEEDPANWWVTMPVDVYYRMCRGM